MNNRDEPSQKFRTEITDIADPDSSPELPVQGWDRYKFEAKLGSGGMALVYKAVDTQLNRVVALKFIRGDDEKFRERLLREARAQARLEHDYVCKIYEVGQVQGKSFIAMQYIHGSPLNTLTYDMNLEQKIKVIAQVAEALHAAHQIGIIHRDVKPSNIMVERKEDGSFRPYLMDFGIAREISAITLTEGLVGTPHFMSPEQAEGEHHLIDRRSDVYSCGATLYSILAGSPPFEGTPLDVLTKISRQDAVPLRKKNPTIPQDLETIVSKCLEKQPQHRYDSAHALANDLNRYLNGETIIARRAGFASLIYRKSKKHKALAAVVAVSLCVIVSLAVFGLQTRRLAQKQAALAQRFGQEITNIEGILRTAYLWPLHDVSTEKSSIRKRMKFIEDQMSTLGKPALAPGNYALGRGYLALNENEEARQHLQQAWDAGYQEPEVAYGLGLALGRLYQKELEDVKGTRDKSMRAAKTREIESKYRNPALQYLRAGKSEAAEYVQALIAFYEARWEEALKNAAVARKKNPGLYEIALLEGEIYRSIAGEQAASGKNTEAAENFERAGKYYLEVVQIARSDPAGYKDLCTVHFDFEYMKSNAEGGDLITGLKKSIAYCEQGLRADSNNVDLLIQQARSYRMMTDKLVEQGSDASDALHRGTDLAARAVRNAPKNGRAHSVLGAMYWSQAAYESARGIDPRNALRNAIRSYQEATRLIPGLEYSWLAMGACFQDIATFEMAHGNDPTNSIHDAIKNNENVKRLRPTYYGSYVNASTAYALLAQYEVQIGKDPSEASLKAIENSQKALQLNSKLVSAYSNNCSIYLTLGIYQMDHGKNAEQSLGKASENCALALQKNPQWLDALITGAQTYRALSEFKRLQAQDNSELLQLALQNVDHAFKLNPAFIEAFLEYGEIHCQIARSKLDAGQSPIAEADFGDSFADKAYGIDANDYRSFFLKGRLAMLRARWLLQQRKSADATLQAAKQDFQNALKLNAGEAKVLQSLADYDRWRAEALLSKHQNPEKEIAEGFYAIEKALAIKPDLAEAYAIRGILYLEKSRLDKDSQSNQDLETGRESMVKAFQMNNNLQKSYESYWKRIE